MLQTGMFTEPGISSDSEKQLASNNINILLLAEESTLSATETESEDLPSETHKPINIQQTESGEYIIFGNNIPLSNGNYSYELRIRPDKTVTFDNDLEIYSQGVNGSHALHFETDEVNNYTMIVNGVFENILTSSSLLALLSAADEGLMPSDISEDSYSYQLNLKTNEGFSYTNILSFLSGSDPCGYSLNFDYDVLTNKPTLVITDLSNGSKTDLL
ncbi:MAG: hypothetical protein IKE43_10655 [Coriobacteriales bacterium]|nr:hypothetical protein [Coriobacteriales bacterium]